MPNKKFLEEYPLYRKFKVEQIESRTDQLPTVQINMECKTCKSNQTFVMQNNYWENCDSMNFPVNGLIFRAQYLCVHCQIFRRIFFIKADTDDNWFMKVGQFPSWEIKGDKNIEKLLGNHAGYYQNGLVCESQGYGIGAFGYYRRIVEETIDSLLEEIAELLSEEEQLKYQEALNKTKKTTVTREKIDLVKDLLPSLLRPDGMNPLSALHSALSEGLHAESDEECLEYAETCRTILVFLVNQVAATKAASSGFTASMRKLLDKKSTKTN
ncbi:MAG: hypothetical protein ACI9CB_001464 [Rhodothermales bacterium]|jgi:hypothetical protein